jgi:hypothetical protein
VCSSDLEPTPDLLEQLLDFLSDLPEDQFVSLTERFPYRPLLSIAQANLELPVGDFALRCLALCCSSPSFPTVLFYNPEDLLFFLICLDFLDTPVAQSAIRVIALICIREPRICEILCTLDLVDKMRRLPLSPDIGVLVQRLCQLGDSYCDAGSQFILPLLSSGDPQLQQYGLKSFGIVCLQGNPDCKAELSSFLLSNFMAFLGSEDSRVFECFLELLPFIPISDAPPGFSAILLQFMRNTPSLKAVELCGKVFFLLPVLLDSPEVLSQLCRILLKRITGGNYGIERSLVLTLAKFYGVSGIDDGAVCNLFIKYIMDETAAIPCLNGLYVILQGKGGQAMEFLGDAAQELIGGLELILESANEHLIILAQDILGILRHL